MRRAQVIGPEVPEGFGQIYDRIDASYLKEIPGVRQKMANCGRWAFLAAELHRTHREMGLHCSSCKR